MHPLFRLVRRTSTLLPHFPSTRFFVGAASGDPEFQPSKIKIFDRDLKRKQRDRAAWLMGSKDALVDAVAENLLDRLQDCKRSFSTALCLGGSLAAVRRTLHGRGGVQELFMMDMSYDMIRKCRDVEGACDSTMKTFFLVGDEEFLPFKESSLDLIVSCLGLHWTNDLPGAMIQSRLALKPDGLFLAAILGGETLKLLLVFSFEGAKNCMYCGTNGKGGGYQSSKFSSSTALELIEHLREMGETNALLQRNHILKRETALATAAVYQSMFAAEDGTVPATFQVFYMTGWREHPSQQKAKRRGSATVSFEDIKKHFGSDSTVDGPG
ncbi:putative methyltransferase At1g22800, mitochondrial isoform X4 [Nymphaea colorata]|uniref:putative methyltransferase At1g22800, mitochondrial isoform X4 n=1 Tax=Nymphaea colorata TaxID=210225 RepID=UPI00129EBFCD|nr:putative methyltransferase At1g22800, mitochondrial isoform X4 [Nymphaea colorata]